MWGWGRVVLAGALLVRMLGVAWADTVARDRRPLFHSRVEAQLTPFDARVQEPIPKHTQEAAAELKLPEASGGSDEREALEARLRMVTTAAEVAGFNRALDRWFARAKPEWFDFALPAALPPQTPKELEDALEHPAAGALDPETAKYALLLAADRHQTLALRVKAFRDAIRVLAELPETREEVYALLRPLWSDTDFATFDRGLWFEAQLHEARHDPTALAELLKQPLAKDLAPSQVAYYQGELALGRVDADNATALAAFAGGMLDHPLDAASGSLVGEVLNRLGELGAFAEADAVGGRFRTATVAGDLQSQRDDLMLQIARDLERDKRDHPRREAWRTLLLSGSPNSTPQAAARYRSARQPLFLARLPYDAQVELGVYLVRTRRVPAAMRLTRFELARALDHLTHSARMGLRLLAVECRDARDDGERAEVVHRATLVTDIDDPTQVQEALSVFQAYRQGDAPKTQAALRELDLKIAVRHGDAAGQRQAEAALVQAGEALTLRHKVQLVQAYLAHDTGALQRILEDLPSQDLLDQHEMTTTLPALKQAGLASLTELVRHRATEKLHAAILQSWATGMTFRASEAMHLATALGQPEAIPAVWIAAMQKRYGHTSLGLQATHFAAKRQGDWAGALKATEAQLQIDPVAYDYDFLRGEALLHLHRKADAAAALTTYLQYTHDEVEVLDAKAMLAEAQR